MTATTAQRLFGFGPIGYLALGVLLTLGWAVRFGGVDFQDLFLVRVTDWFGIGFTYWFVPRWMASSAFALWAPQYSLVTASVLTVTMFVCCRGMRFRVYLLIWLMALLWPMLTWQINGSLARHGVKLGLSHDQIAVVMGGAPLVVLAWKARAVSAFVCVLGSSGVATAGLFGPPLLLDYNPSGGVVYYVSAWWIAYHAMLAGGVVWWAWRHWEPPCDDDSLCAQCGYELTGLAGKICPECGVSITPVP